MSPTPRVRRHLILVPGFVGFDVLGQLGYYVAVTEEFGAWLAAADPGRSVGLATLHYFDNFPTASVTLRARRLRDYLAKKLARGEIGSGDEVTLLGHSTGGLDVRALLRDLIDDAKGYTLVDGRYMVDNADALRTIRRLVFLSVPHYGTNLGDYAHRFRASIQGVVRDLGLCVQFNREPATLLRDLLMPSHDTRSDFLAALNDALWESDEGRFLSEAERANERQARAALALWLEHIGQDFGALDDLRTTNEAAHTSCSPAHASDSERAEELRAWNRLGIQTLSYATWIPDAPRRDGVDRAVRFLKLWARPANAWYGLLNRLARAWYLPPVSALAVMTRALSTGLPTIVLLRLLHRRPELLFEFIHAICRDAEGSFSVPPESRAISPTAFDMDARRPRSTMRITAADNDGIVNTASMLWPPAQGDDHLMKLVQADHGDVIGHYRRRTVAGPSGHGRQFFGYDIFPSRGGFDDRQFRRVWKDILDFSFAGPDLRAKPGRGAGRSRTTVPPGDS